MTDDNGKARRTLNLDDQQESPEYVVRYKGEDHAVDPIELAMAVYRNPKLVDAATSPGGGDLTPDMLDAMLGEVRKVVGIEGLTTTQLFTVTADFMQYLAGLKKNWGPLSNLERAMAELSDAPATPKPS